MILIIETNNHYNTNCCERPRLWSRCRTWPYV